MKKQLFYSAVAMVLLASCNSGSSGNTNYPGKPTNLVGVRNLYKCLPSDLPTMSSNGFKIAYGENCTVADASNIIKPTLESMAIAITKSNAQRYCTGTPLSYDPNTGYGYVLSAAHCVMGNQGKNAGVEVTSDNIGTFTSNINYVSQVLNASGSNLNTGTITAVYIPQQYCKNYSIVYGRSGYQCSNLAGQDGDIALFRVHYDTPVNYNAHVKLANPSLTIPYPSYIMALGYGITNSDEHNTNLYYITYEYFAKNSYMGENGLSTIMNGYSVNNAFYSIICGGDSGGGDFYWDGTNWQLVGVHSYGSLQCGAASPSYSGAMDASADVRLFTNQLTNLIGSTESNCDNNLASANGFICAQQAN
ncbi:MAG: trypsin-like serine protease [Burkholderiales bacterium]|nr:trypsin-like serine protease [Burkholderiales bacterium]